MNPNTAVFFALFASALLFQSCSKPETGPRITVEITLLEEIEDKSEISKWLQEFVKETTGEKGTVEVVVGGKALSIEIPAAALGEVRAALKMWEGPTANGFGMHAVKRGTPEEVKAVAAGAETIADHTALPFQDKSGEYLIVKSDSVIEYSEIESARPLHTHEGWFVSVQFSPAGAKKMLAFTTAEKGNKIALVLNGEILSAPTIMEPFGNGCQITGNFTQEEATALAQGVSNPPPSKFSVTPKAKPIP